MAGRLQADRLTALARDGLGDAIDACLGDAFAGDRRVHVIRSVTAHVMLAQCSDAADDEARARWATQLARTIARGSAGDAGVDIVTFDDEVDFVCSFIRELLYGDPWRMWCFGAFAGLRGLPIETILLRVALEPPDRLPVLLGALRQRDLLTPVLDALGPEHHAKPWAALVPERERTPGIESIVAVALDLASALELVRPSATLRSALAARARREAPDVDWTVPTQLAAAVVWALRSLERHGELTATSLDLEMARERIAAAIRERRLDWLDGGVLERELLELVDRVGVRVGADEPERSEAQSQPVRDDGERAPVVLAPVHRTLLRDLARAFERCGLSMLGEHSPASRIELLAALVELDPNWADRSATVPLLERWLDGLEVLSRELGQATRTADPTDVMALIRAARAGRPDPVLALVERGCAEAPAMRSAVADAVAGARSIPMAGTEHAANESPAAEVGRAIRSPVCGTFLLVRALVDVSAERLVVGVDDSLLRHAAAGLRAALCLAWSGAKRWDRAVEVFSGATPVDLTIATEHVDPVALLQSLEELMTGLRVDARADVEQAVDVLCPEAIEASSEWLRSISIVAASLLRAWARWLPRVGGSSVPYLLENFIRRSGELRASSRRIQVLLDPGPMDVVLEMARYFDPVESVPWLDGASVELVR